MNSGGQLFCQVRKIWVNAAPEELVRQGVINYLTHQLGYLSGGIAVEVSLQQMPHLSLINARLPRRRADIVVFHQGSPLLLIECKAVKMTTKTIRQVLGYNWYLKAPFIAVVNAEETRFGWFDSTQNSFCFDPRIPHFQELLKNLDKI